MAFILNTVLGKGLGIEAILAAGVTRSSLAASSRPRSLRC
jgi:hypothetical protein